MERVRLQFRCAATALAGVGLTPRLLGFLFATVIAPAVVAVGLIVWAMPKWGFHEAIKVGTVEFVEAALDKNPRLIEYRSKIGTTPLQQAAWAGRTDMAEMLIRRGADVNATCSLAYRDGGWNALHVAGIQGRTAVAGVLIRAGANVNQKSLKGETPLDVAEKNGHTELAQLLRAHGGRTGR